MSGNHHLFIFLAIIGSSFTAFAKENYDYLRQQYPPSKRKDLKIFLDATVVGIHKEYKDFKKALQKARVHNIKVASPETLVAKLNNLSKALGGFNTKANLSDALIESYVQKLNEVYSELEECSLSGNVWENACGAYKSKFRVDRQKLTDFAESENASANNEESQERAAALSNEDSQNQVKLFVKVKEESESVVNQNDSSINEKDIKLFVKVTLTEDSEFDTKIIADQILENIKIEEKPELIKLDVKINNNKDDLHKIEIEQKQIHVPEADLPEDQIINSLITPIDLDKDNEKEVEIIPNEIEQPNPKINKPQKREKKIQKELDWEYLNLNNFFKEEEPVEEEPINKKPIKKKQIEHEKIEEEPIEEEPTDEKPIDENPIKEESSDKLLEPAVKEIVKDVVPKQNNEQQEPIIEKVKDILRPSDHLEEVKIEKITPVVIGPRRRLKKIVILELMNCEKCTADRYLQNFLKLREVSKKI